ncbi:hypothetical protein HK096_004720, partial [Nowakowskiella sp. JEL0078]
MGQRIRNNLQDQLESFLNTTKEYDADDKIQNRLFTKDSKVAAKVPLFAPVSKPLPSLNSSGATVARTASFLADQNSRSLYSASSSPSSK